MCHPCSPYPDLAGLWSLAELDRFERLSLIH